MRFYFKYVHFYYYSNVCVKLYFYFKVNYLYTLLKIILFRYNKHFCILMAFVFCEFNLT